MRDLGRSRIFDPCHKNVLDINQMGFAYVREMLKEMLHMII